ncbi:DUF4260 family protein [Candidatus Enterococcus willemsii]|uniref:DUF4260 family protein n=1 Tax=Candidatus Enterococcus willemsii TaxID=1857215 RepID=A0ABQ6YZW4_9ENTE|nr:DUF4260 family protein [Enterococcus sp. CU12B]KAF1303470.1 hypothetical protein BAU17_12225 [Enterococcus sp. CU12B]
MNKKIIQIENLLLFLLIICLYFSQQFSFLLFIGTFFIPDITILLYLVNPSIGKLGYNFFHSFALPFLLYLFLLFLPSIAFIKPMLLIWFAHIAMDRMLGMGLKEASFTETHLDKLS